MRKAVPLFVITLLALGAPALAAQGPKDGAPPGTTGSGSISAEDLAANLNTMQARKHGLVINYVLPKGWTINEAKSIDKKTGKERADVGVYVVDSRRPMPDPKEPVDFVFELDVFKQGLTDDLPKNTTPAKRAEVRAERLWGFLNGQISLNLKNNLKLKTPKRAIEAKPYGPESRGKKTMFIPIEYEVLPNPKVKGDKGAYLFTFTSFEGETVWMLKFLVTKGAEEEHGALIALILHNAWAVTEEVEKKLREKGTPAPKVN
jgi:hypothetical protein